MLAEASSVSPDRQEESTGMRQVSDGNSLTDVLVLMVQGVPELKDSLISNSSQGIFFSANF